MGSLKRTHWVHCGHISGYFMEELSGFFHKVPARHFAEQIVKEIKGFFHNVTDGLLVG